MHTTATRPVSGPAFDWGLTLLAAWVVGGAWVDAWAHHALPGLETFFTPWHGILYSGLIATLGFLTANLALNLRRGHPWRLALPPGYHASLFGAVLFGLGGMADMAWHEAFGVEVELEALLSPTHLLLGVAAALIVSGPFRAALHRRPDPGRPTEILPALISLALLLSLLIFFTGFAHPFSTPLAAADLDAVARATGELGGGLSVRAAGGPLGQALGVSGILVQTALLMGVVFVALHRWSLPFGGITLLFAISLGLTVVPHQQFQFLPAAILGGLGGDVLLHGLRPAPERPARLRAFAFGVPLILYALYFLTLALTGGIGWSVHLWAGAMALAALTGLLTSYLVVPAARPGATTLSTRPGG